MYSVNETKKDNSMAIPLLSIIIPVYNASEFIAETLDSAISQTYKSIEIICVDDCSTDNSAEIISTYIQKHNNITYIKNSKNMGLSTSRNNGIDLSESEYILPLDSDDIIDKTYCEKAMNTFKADPTISVIYCKAQFFNEKGTWDWALPKYNAHRMLFRNLVFASAFFKKSDWKRFNGYSASMIYGFEDWDFWLNFVQNKLKFHQLPETLFFYRRQKSIVPCMSTDLKNKNKKRLMIQQIRKNHPKLYHFYLYKRALAYLATLLSRMRN